MPAVPNHTVFQCIGGGSYGKVWLARDAMGEWRAVKAVYQKRFALEPRAYEREYEGIRSYSPVSLRHERLLPILHVGQDAAAGCYYYVMEAADNEDGSRPRDERNYRPRSLYQVMKKQRRLPAKDCVSIATDLAEALERLHREGLLHRDIKPANIIFVHGRPKLADLGLVASFGATLTEVGTLGYIAPELFGKPEGDVYALGKVLYEAATGLDRLNFPVLPLAREMSREDHEWLLELSMVFNKACSLVPGDRYRDAEEMLKDLLLLKAGESLRQQQRWRQWRARVKKHQWQIAATLLMGAGALGFGIQRQHAVETARRREVLLRTAQLIRARDHMDNWSSNIWANCIAAANLRLDDDVRDEAVKSLAGLDAHPLQIHQGRVGSSAAFASDGRVVVGGWRNSRGKSFPGLLIHTNGVLEELPVQGAGPVCWAPGGTALQWIADTNACELREMLTGALRWRFQLAAGDEVADNDCPVVAMSFDGGLVAAAVARRDAREQGEIYHGERVLVWDAATGKALPDVLAPASALAFSPDGALLVAGRPDGSIGFYALPDMTNVFNLPPASQPIPVSCLALAEDRLVPYDTARRTNRWMLGAGYKGGQVALWDLDRRRVRRFYDGSVYAVVSLAFLQDGQTLAAGGHTSGRLYDLMTGRMLLRLERGAGDEGRALAIDDNSSRLLWGTIETGGSPGVVLWNLVPHRGIQLLRGLSSGIRKLWFSANPQQNLIAALSDSWQVAVWELPSGRLRYVFEVPAGMYADNAGGAFDSSGGRFALATWHEARLYDLVTGRVMNRWALNDGLSDQMQFNASNQLLLVRREQGPSSPPGSRNWWRLYHLDTDGSVKALREQTNTHFRTIETLFRSGGEQFVVWDAGKMGTRRTITAYNVAGGNPVWNKETDELKLTQPVVHLDLTGQWLLYTADNTPFRRLIHLPEWMEVAVVPHQCAAINPSGDQVAVPERDGLRVRNRQGESKGVLLSADPEGLGGPTFSPDGRLVVWGTVQGMVFVADVAEVTKQLATLGNRRN
ncbi:MAG TPA: WD40 repeat domain-containing serine/threonine-protein kinase [Verrucomicrobiae bacterium]|nr:WD40 repeat domain-containing serine/threonine-protein kinase [Verrucomicrobiae bacterium]